MSSLSSGHTDFKAEAAGCGTTLGGKGLDEHSTGGLEEIDFLINSRNSQSYTCLHTTATGQSSETEERGTGLDDVPAMQNNPGYCHSLFLESKERNGLTTGDAFSQKTGV